MNALLRIARRRARQPTFSNLLHQIVLPAANARTPASSRTSPGATDTSQGFAQLNLSPHRLFATKEAFSQGKASKLSDGSNQRKTKRKDRFGTYDNDFEDELDDMPAEEGIDHLYDPRSIVEEWLGHPTFFGMIAEDALSSSETSKDGPPGEGPILRWETRLVLGPGGDGWHPANRKVKVSVYVKELELSKNAKERLLALVGKRYNLRKDELTIVSERYEHREENRKDVLRTLYALIEEAQNADKIAMPA